MLPIPPWIRLFIYSSEPTHYAEKNCLEITPIVYTYTWNSHTQAPPTVKIKIKLISVMIIGLMRTKRRKNPPGIWTRDLWNSRRDPYNCTTMYMVSGHHSNTFSSISPNQRRQSKFPTAKSLVLIHSACVYKNYVPKYSQPPVNYFSYFFQVD